MEVKRSKTNEIYHHGIKGQRWGRRRYQNPDGSLTPEGRKHYGIDTKAGREAAINSGDVKKIKAIKNELTSEEMNRALNRIQLNDRLNSLDRSTLSRGEDWLKTHKDTVLSLTAAAGAVAATTASIVTTYKKLSGKKSEVEMWQDKAKVAAAKQKVQQVADWFAEREKNKTKGIM